MYRRGMRRHSLPTGPDPAEITGIILERYPEMVIATSMGATLFSLDETYWPNLATIVTTEPYWV